ncbi:MAG: WYL domain-containing protein [Bacteroidales bacterium]|nr:WYL domain-containing protein [Bacteroidales bacterium]
MKTSTSYLVARYIWLLNLIYEAGSYGISREEINRRWRDCIYNDNHEPEISRKTFYNYKCEIESLFGITLDVSRIDGHFRYRIAEEDSLQRSQVKRLLLNSLSINEAVSNGGELAERILLEDIPSAGGTALSTIIQALRTNRALSIVHKSFKPDAHPVAAVVYPLCLKLREQRWYMLAWRPSDSTARVYGVDRIGECTVTDEEFDARKVAALVLGGSRGAVPEDYFRDFYGVLIDDTVPLMDVTIRVYTSQYVNYFRSLPLHSSQVEVNTVSAGSDPGALSVPDHLMGESSYQISDSAYSDFSYHIHPTLDFTRKLLSYGQFVKVLSPAEYVAEFASIFRLAAGNYELGQWS